MFLCVRGIYIKVSGHVFVLGVSILKCAVMFLCVRGIDIKVSGHVFVCEGYLY